MLTNRIIPETITGLNEEEVKASRAKYGDNVQPGGAEEKWWQAVAGILKEPMLLLLIAVAVLYLFTGQYKDAVFMLFSIVAVSGISFFQDTRNRKALEALKRLNEPLSKVIRSGKLYEVATHEIVVGDMMLVEEGNIVNADGEIVSSNDFMVDESSLTGESYPVYKFEGSDDRKVYSGSLVTSGLAICRVENTGGRTRLGKLSESILSAGEEVTPLQLQIRGFVKVMAIAGTAVFLLVCLVNFCSGQTFTESLLKGLTMAMSVLPEEIPVAFTTFMALGSWRLIRAGIIVKKISIVEALGSATVICTDKTGTITENRMSLQEIYSYRNHRSYTDPAQWDSDAAGVITTSMWASEPVPFDSMEHTLHQAYSDVAGTDLRTQFSMVHEYPLSGMPPMMTHVFEDGQGNRIIAAKGAPEAILAVSVADPAVKPEIEEKIADLTGKGYRVLGVAESSFSGSVFPERQQDLPFIFTGLVAFYDPPKANIPQVFEAFSRAGIEVKMITGDNAATAATIARLSGLKNPEDVIEGAALMAMTPEERKAKMLSGNVFARMYPEAKLEMINTLKDAGSVVAMTGDGVNDGPALKAAHIGIAMGKRGTEIAKSAAALVIADDDLARMLDAVAMGRKIYANLKKAVQYIISIHIPIIGTVALPLFLGWVYPDIFTPVHVIFLELIMGPTCSIVYENEPPGKDTMVRPPRPLTSTFLSWREMSVSIIQGAAITAGVLFVYQYAVRAGEGEDFCRTMVFSTLIMANIFLSLVNRSFYYPVSSSFHNGNKLMTAALLITVTALAVILYVPAVSSFFRVVPPGPVPLLICFFTAAISVLWFELWKWRKRVAQNN
ncbi:cation-translocating P-type ATPase [Pararcticibacter amylolyticus]|uniref:Haloacid dehalogenase n=1 Tax=Pararcticibacter amylolyticus TaxID=2173175 RepID=A0A2U2PAK1_9SPHI|nr:cation-translocating P-type ATPase [Pararcticibacter amylolyticus]PWG78412.1 haloacid dehalogenase [Pararcticibacter amylolyticus]